MPTTLAKKSHTKIIQRKGSILGTLFTDIVYYETTIITFNNSYMWLSCGKYKTVSTKNRLNQASKEFNLGFSVYQKAKQWFVSYKGKELAFLNGMLLAR